MTLEIIIPHEIEKLGPEARKVYFEALSKGKEKIPYCNLLILGKEEVGKTSLLRQLVREPFKEVLDRTRGINNETVDTVQRINIEIDKEEWVAKKDSDKNYQFLYVLAGEFMDNFQEKDHVDPVTENDLLLQLENIHTEHSVNPEPTLQHGDEPDSGVQDTINSPTEEKLYPKPTPNPEFKESNEPPTNTVENKEGGMLIINSMESFLLNKLIMHKKKKTPSVIFNVKDFAGQSVYRPMHHCFISKRGIFVVVFKLPEMLRYIQNQDTHNPLDDISYWVQSVHAHITRPNDRERDKGKKLKRVLLVGTRRKEVQPKDLKSIDEFIGTNFMDKKKEGRCINHIRLIGGSSNYRYFIPVENSIDFYNWGEAYLEESGTKLVKDTIIAISKTLPHINDVYPFKWLRFEELLKQQRKLTPVMKIKEINKLSIKSGIIVEEQRNLALKFFHETGKIICLSKYKLVTYQSVPHSNTR